ncbi:MAG: hypothetical protein II600_05180, partial [Bacteroidaceae bacterium]|nr:hypothetical protein [Bacteroidaceae bacterium]
MRQKFFLWIAFFALPFAISAQVDDDMYFVPGKSKAASRTTTLSSATSSTSRTQSAASTVDESAWDGIETDPDYHSGALRDVDDYNRRGTSQPVARLVGDT